MIKYFRMFCMILLAVFVVACGKEGGKLPIPTIETKSNFILGAIVQDDSVSSNLSKSISGNKVVTTAVTGTIKAIRDTGEEEIIEWLGRFDEENYIVESETTLAFKPGKYDFELKFEYKGYIYVGKQFNFDITADNIRELNFVINPIIGDLDVVIDVNKLPSLKVKYDHEELASISDPFIEVLIGGNSTMLRINKALGTAESFVTIPKGQHSLDLKLYDSSLQVGRAEAIASISSDDVNKDIVMNIIPLYGETTLVYNLGTSQLKTTFKIPTDIIAEVGGLENLKAIAKINGTATENVQQEKELVVTEVNGVYVSELVFEGVKPGVITLIVDFIDKKNGDNVATAKKVDINLSSTAQTINLTVDLVNRNHVTGSILGVLALNVYDEGHNGVAGAELYIDNEFVNSTNNQGYIKLYLKKGEHNIVVKNKANGFEEKKIINISPLSVNNHNIILKKKI